MNVLKYSFEDFLTDFTCWIDCTSKYIHTWTHWDVSQRTVDGFKPLIEVTKFWGKQDGHQEAHEIIYEMGYHVEANKRPEELGRLKVKFTLEQAMKAQRGSRGIALLFP